MRIEIDFDEDILLSYEKRGSNPFFIIYWDYNGIVVPNHNWFDFGSVILGWWMLETRKLFTVSNNIKLRFMECDEYIDVSREGRMIKMYIPKEGKMFYMDDRMFIKELIRSSIRVQSEFHRLGIAKAEYDSLSEGIKMIKNLV